EAVVLRRVVAPRHLDAATQTPLRDREVHERCRAHADVEHVDARARDALAQRGRIAVRGEAAVTADRNLGRSVLACDRPERSPESSGEVGVEIPFRHTADVVLAEDLRLQLNTSTECRSRRSFESQSWKRCSTAFW